MDAMALIAAERRRQQEVEGWSIAHDDEHTDGSLFKAAMCYVTFDPDKHNPNVAPRGWPISWDDMWFKPRSRQENLIRAGALCLAEIERRHRAAINISVPLSRALNDIVGQLAALTKEAA